jgi:hypothetical protein
LSLIAHVRASIKMRRVRRQFELRERERERGVLMAQWPISKYGPVPKKVPKVGRAEKGGGLYRTPGKIIRIRF